MEITIQAIITSIGIIVSVSGGYLAGVKASAKQSGKSEAERESMRKELDDLKRDTSSSFAAMHLKHDNYMQRHDEKISRVQEKSDQVLLSQGRIEAHIESLFKMIETQGEQVQALINHKLNGG